MWRKFLRTENDYTLTAVRFVLGFVFFVHGAQVIRHWLNGAQSFAIQYPEVPAPFLLRNLVVVSSFFGGLAVLVGFLARAGALLILANMAVSALTVHRHFGFVMNWSGTRLGEGFGFYFLALALALVIVVKGAGAFSIDRFFGYPHARPKYEYHLKNWSDVQDHLPRFFEAACGNCLEIGTRIGSSTSALLYGIEKHGGHLWSMDINNCPVFVGHPNWTFIQADSIKSAKELKAVLPESLELLFVDGDHTFEGALSDLRNFGPMAKRIFVHDTDAPNFPGVRQAVEEFVKETGRKLTYHSGSYGMAEIE